MAIDQGGAGIWVRKGDVVTTAMSVIGGFPDEQGVSRGLHIVDWDASTVRQTADSPDEELGLVTRSALRWSRVDYPRSLADAREASDDFGIRLAQAFGLSSARSLYPGIRNIAVFWALGSLTLSPSRHRRGSHFEGFPLGANRGHEDIVLPFSVTDSELGAAVRVCIGRSL